MHKMMEEKCDDGNRKSGDGCDKFCRVEEGFVCEDEIDRIPPECRSERAGVGYFVTRQGAPDQCQQALELTYPPKNPLTDEFNPESQDGAPLNPDVCKEECGDRRHFHLDGCDDGNWADDDGCDQ